MSTRSPYLVYEAFTASALPDLTDLKRGREETLREWGGDADDTGGNSVPSNAIPLLQELRDDVGTSKARSTSDLHSGAHKSESQNRSSQGTMDKLTKTSPGVIGVRYRKKAMSVVDPPPQVFI